MRIIEEHAYAKINLYLDIERKTEDGYHDLLTVMQLVSLCDEIKIEPNGLHEIVLECEGMPTGADDRKNLAFVAAKAFYNAIEADCAEGVNIYLKKNIPVAAGLGGGSADAAAVLRGLNRLYGEPLNREELCRIGMSIGSDVPFCIVGGTQICRGRGEIAEEIRGLDGCNILVAVAGNKASTAQQYKRLDLKYNDFKDYISGTGYVETLDALRNGKSADSLVNTYNIFDTLYESDELMKKVKQIMLDCGARSVLLSGSGPSVYGVFDGSPDEAEALLLSYGMHVYPCEPITALY